VKNFFKNGTAETGEFDTVYGTKIKNELLVITKKPITPGEQELKLNPRSRSAKLRIAQRI
jgi:16S rRNA (cytosine1402-N4)-methyltransferase